MCTPICEAPLPRKIPRARVVYSLAVSCTDGRQLFYISRSRERLRALWRRQLGPRADVADSPAPFLDWISRERDAAGRWIYPRAAVTSRRHGVEFFDPENLLT